MHWGGQVEDDSLQVDWLTKASGLLALGGAESIFMSVLLVKQILTAYYLPLEGSEEDIVAQHRHMIHMEAVITAVSSHRNTWSDKTAGQIRSLSALRSSPHTSVIWGGVMQEKTSDICLPLTIDFVCFFPRSIQNANWWMTVISLICHLNVRVWDKKKCCSFVVPCLMFLSLTYLLQPIHPPHVTSLALLKICNCRTDGRLYKPSLQ